MSPEFNPNPKPATETGRSLSSRLLPEPIRGVLPRIEAIEGNVLEAYAQVRLIAPEAPSWSLYVAAFDGEDTLFGLWVSLYDVQMGRFSLLGCENAAYMSVQRDETFAPIPLRQLQQQFEAGLSVDREKSAAINPSEVSEDELSADTEKTLLSRKAELLSLWRRIPAEHQPSIALELLGAEFINEWDSWVREKVLQQLFENFQHAHDEK